MGNIKPVKVLAVSDLVVDHLYAADVRSRFPQVEMLIGCGDLPYYYLEFLVSAFDLPLVYVRGNHDGGPQHRSDGRVTAEVQGGIDLHRYAAVVKGCFMAGLEGSMRYRPRDKLMYTEKEMTLEIAGMLPRLLWMQRRLGRRLDVLVTHSPPHDIHDDTDLPHTGFRVFRTFMRYFKPRYLLHGHVHRIGVDVKHLTQFADTTVINVFPYRHMDLSCPEADEKGHRLRRLHRL